jgi:hypothetical protein
MAEFSDAYTELLDYMNRNSTEMGDRAKALVNEAVNWANRMHDFKALESMAEVTYPANTRAVTLSSFCGETLRNLINVDMIPAAGTGTQDFGYSLRIVDGVSLMQERKDFKENHKFTSDYAALYGYDPNQWENDTWQTSFNHYVTRGERRLCFTIGEYFGLYPVPTENTLLVGNWTKESGRVSK